MFEDSITVDFSYKYTAYPTYVQQTESICPIQSSKVNEASGIAQLEMKKYYRKTQMPSHGEFGGKC